MSLMHTFVADWPDNPSHCRECGEVKKTFEHLRAEVTPLTFDVCNEVARASLNHQPFNSHHEAKSVIEEEFNEYWDLVKLNPRKPMVHPTKGTPLTVDQWRDELRTELIQTAAMCVRALHDLCGTFTMVTGQEADRTPINIAADWKLRGL